MKEGFKLPEDGLYSGFDADTQTYDKSTWNYEEGGDKSGEAATAAPAQVHTGGAAASQPNPASANTNAPPSTQQIRPRS